MPVEITYSKSIKNDLDYFIGKPFLMRVHFDGENEAEMQFSPTWKHDDVVEAIQNSMKLHAEVHGIVKHVHIVEVREIVSHKN